MKLKNALMTAASAAVISTMSASAFAEVEIWQLVGPEFEVSPWNNQSSYGPGDSAASVSDANQVIQSTANSYASGLSDGLNTLIQTIGDGADFSGENSIGADASDVGNAYVSGVQVFLNTANSIDVGELTGDVSVMTRQQTFEGSVVGDNLGGFYDVDQRAVNNARSDAGAGAVTAIVDQLGQNVKNSVGIADENTDNGTLVGVDIGQWAIDNSDQSVYNNVWAENDTGVGDGTAGGSQRAFNLANVVNVGVDVEGNAAVRQRGASHNGVMDQDADNDFLLRVGDEPNYTGSATITFIAAVEDNEATTDVDESVQGGGQVASNVLNSASFSGEVGGILSVYQSSNIDLPGLGTADLDQRAANELHVDNDGVGNAIIMAEEGSLGQVAFNTLNNLTVDGSKVGSGVVEQAVWDPDNGLDQTAYNDATAYANNGLASITGLGQVAGVSVNVITAPSSN